MVYNFPKETISEHHHSAAVYVVLLRTCTIFKRHAALYVANQVRMAAACNQGGLLTSLHCALLLLDMARFKMKISLFC